MKLYPFGKYILSTPDDHKVRRIHAQDVLYDRAYAFLIEEISARDSDGVLLDVGANIGDTAAFFATHARNPIVSVEGSEAFLPYIRQNLKQFGSQVTLVDKFLRTDPLCGYSMRYQSLEGTGWMEVVATAEESNVDDGQMIDVDRLIEVCLEAGPRLALAKSDTDGFDGFIVQALMQRTDAPLFFECDTVNILSGVASPWPDVFGELSRREYNLVVYDNVGLPLCISETPEQTLRDLSGWIHTQHSVDRIRVHYLDVWAFPRSKLDLFDAVSNRLRSAYLKPYSF